MKRILAFLVAISLTGSLAACKKDSPSGTMLSKREIARVMAFSEPRTDQMLEGLQNGDYDQFSQDFTADLLKSMPESEFEEIRQRHDKWLGRYFSRDVETIVKRSNGTYTVIYNVIYANDNEVLLRVVFQADEPHQISEVWFDK